MSPAEEVAFRWFIGTIIVAAANGMVALVLMLGAWLLDAGLMVTIVSVSIATAFCWASWQVGKRLPL